MMTQHGAAIAQVEDEKYPEFDAITADFVYARLRRCSEDEPTGYSPQALDTIAERFQAHAAPAATASSISSTAPKSAPPTQPRR